MTSLPSEMVAIVGTVDPDANGAGTASTDVIDMRYFDYVMFIVMAGALGTDATLDFDVKYDTASGGSFSSTVTGKSITQLTEAGSDDDKQAIVVVSAAELAAEDIDARYLRGDLATATATSDSAVVALGFCSRYQPASDFDLASVAEIVT